MCCIHKIHILKTSSSIVATQDKAKQCKTRQDVAVASTRQDQRCVLKTTVIIHDDVIKWKHFPRYWPFVRGIHRSPVNSPHNGQWRGALMFSLICAPINGWVNNGEAGDLRRHRAHCDVIVMTGNSLATFNVKHTNKHRWTGRQVRHADGRKLRNNEGWNCHNHLQI